MTACNRLSNLLSELTEDERAQWTFRYPPPPMTREAEVEAAHMVRDNALEEWVEA